MNKNIQRFGMSLHVLNPIPLQKPPHPAGHVHVRIDLFKLGQCFLK